MHQMRRKVMLKRRQFYENSSRLSIIFLPYEKSVRRF